MEDLLRHVTKRQREDVWVDIAFLWLLLYVGSQNKLQHSPSLPAAVQCISCCEIIEVRKAIDWKETVKSFYIQAG